jgi:hypothetical protein
MKFNVEIECTPEEARRFLGLPDVQPMQAALMADLQARLQDAARALEPEALWKMWMPSASEGMAQFGKLWSRFGIAPGGGSDPKSGAKE